MQATFLWGWLLLLCGAGALVFPIDDELALNKYSVSYISPAVWDKSVAQNESALSQGFIWQVGNDLKCYLPNEKNMNELDTFLQRNETERELLIHNSLEKGVQVISDTIDGTCLLYPNGFWNYEYCAGNRFTQFNGNSKTPISMYYLLGKAQEDINKREFQLSLNEYGYYISEILEVGQICDLTGKGRVTEVKYVCDPASSVPTFQWVRETKTCAYEAQISIPGLCKLELFALNDEKKVAKPVVCVKNYENYSNSTLSVDTGLVRLLTLHEPIFLGYGFYLLKPHAHDPMSRFALLYTGTVIYEKDTIKLQKEFYHRAASAMSTMLTSHYSILPEGKPYAKGDAFSWISDVINIDGNFLTMIKCTLDPNATLTVQIEDRFEFAGPGNIEYSKRAGVAQLKDSIKGSEDAIEWEARPKDKTEESGNAQTETALNEKVSHDEL